MKTFKTNKGITLVALIITIIVLLILTVVAISSITDQGLFTKSQEAVNSYEDSRKEEEGKLAGYSSEIDKYLNQQTDKKYVGIINGDLVMLFLSPNNEMTITADGTILANKMKPQEIPAPEGFPNSENYSKFYKSTVNGIEMICGISKDGKVITIVGMGDLELYENIFVTNPKTRVYEASDSDSTVFAIIKPNGIHKYIAIQDGEIVYEQEKEIEIKEFYTVKIAGNEIGTYRYVTIEKNAISDSSGGVDGRISENGEEYYSLTYHTGANNVLNSYSWIGPHILNENITEEMIYQQYPKAQ